MEGKVNGETGREESKLQCLTEREVEGERNNRGKERKE